MMMKARQALCIEHDRNDADSQESPLPYVVVECLGSWIDARR